MTSACVIREYPSEPEAAIAAAVLRANGIHAELRSAHGSFGTTLATTTAVVVSAEHVKRAQAVLEGDGQ
jgi:hypothetical protein